MTFSVSKGEVVSILGPSGSGKTTLFRVIAGLETPSEGSLLIDSHNEDHPVSYMIQEDLLLPWRTLYENLSLVRELQKKKTSLWRFQQEVRLLIDELGLSSSEGLYPAELSGGMRQRVSLARCLLQNRALLLLDEPFGALDVLTRERLYHTLCNLQHRFNTTILLVTHDFKDALTLSDRILLFSKRLGIYEEVIVPEGIDDDPILYTQLQSQLKRSMQEHVGDFKCADETSRYLQRTL